MPLFMMPLALVGLASVPALAAIYWLRNRYRRQVVSSLILWLDQREAREGGRRLQRVQTPLVFFLELLALLGLTLAATDPRLPLAQDRRPVIVVLDDSYSMQAGGDDSPRQRALAAMRKGLGEGSTARFILAGAQPQVMGDPIEVGQASESLLGRWRCESARADLGRAVALAGELGGPRARVLVLTDHAPTDEEAVRGRVRWLAFGQPRPNLAFVNAVRSAHADGQRVLLELANLADTPASTKLSLGSQQRTLELMPGQTQRFWFDVSQDQAPFHASLGNADALAIDNTVTLLPEAERKLRVRLAISDADLQRLVRGALEATGRVELVEFGPELLVTDRDETLSPSPECWLARLIVEEEADAFLGPFVLDRAHPLTQGLILDGVIWAAQQDWETPGMPVIAAGNTPLVTDVEHSDGRHDLRIRVQPKLSTLQDTPNFPALWWNLVDWRLAHTPGLRRANVR
ncbi:MAG TPA: VWA domain-containing protein, partial [Phycisphaeraceae bacterium]